MRRLLRILPLLVIYLVVSAKSCNDNTQNSPDRERSDVAGSMDSITSIFKAGSLDQPSLRAFEVTATLKLKDLEDYIRIINDSSTGKSFKEKAAEMAGELFIKGRKAPVLLPGSVFDSIRVITPLQRLNDTMYSGQLNFQLRIQGNTRTRDKTIHGRIATMDIYALKLPKVFGRDTVRVWNVLLGDIH